MWPKPCRLTLSCKIFVSIWQRILADNESYHVHCTSRGIPLYSQQVFAGILLLWSFGKTNIFPYKYSWNMVVINGSTVLRRENRKADRQQRKKKAHLWMTQNPVGKHLFKFNNKDIKRMSIDVCLKFFLLTLKRYLPRKSCSKVRTTVFSKSSQMFWHIKQSCETKFASIVWIITHLET